MSHPYDKAANCFCDRCERERARRAEQRASAVHNARPVARRARSSPQVASRAEQHARYIDCGPAAWDDR